MAKKAPPAFIQAKIEKKESGKPAEKAEKKEGGKKAPPFTKKKC